ASRRGREGGPLLLDVRSALLLHAAHPGGEGGRPGAGAEGEGGGVAAGGRGELPLALDVISLDAVDGRELPLDLGNAQDLGATLGPSDPALQSDDPDGGERRSACERSSRCP